MAARRVLRPLSVLCMLMRALAFVLRMCALLIAALVLILTFVSGAPRTLLLPISSFLNALIPHAIGGLFVQATLFGGAFRGDFALVAVVLLIADWLLCKRAYALSKSENESLLMRDGARVQRSVGGPPSYPNGGRIPEVAEGYNDYMATPGQGRTEALRRIRSLHFDEHDEYYE